MPPRHYDKSVFLNCPFDSQYQGIFQSLVFTVRAAGLIPRCALEIADSSTNRLGKILQLIGECRFGIHDITRTETDEATGFPRFNMAFELGLYVAWKHFGNVTQRRKSCLILDRDPYRFRAFLSDIAGQDPEAHQNDPQQAVRRVRNWLRTEAHRRLAGEERFVQGYKAFMGELPELCQKRRIRP